MSRVIELQEGLIRDPAYAHEFARLEEVLAKLKAVAQGPARAVPDPAKTRRLSTAAFLPAKARSA